MEQNSALDHQMMGYDRAITMFSPDGRLLQVEYAKKTVKQGSTAIGMVCKDGVLFVTDKRIIDKLIVAEEVEKIWEIDDHIMATAAGIISDARVLVDNAQVKSQQHKLTFDTPIDTFAVVKDVCAIEQSCTQSGGLRPFGISLLIGGIDNEDPVLYLTDPTGIYFKYYATVIGEGEPFIYEPLLKGYKREMKIEEGIRLGINLLKDFLGEKFNAERVDIAYIKSEEKKFQKLCPSDVKKYMK